MPKALARRAFASFVPYRLRLGKAARRRLAFLDRSEAWDRETIRTYQAGELRRLVQFAQTRVPWYQRKYAAAGVDGSGISSPRDLGRLPFLEKADLRESPPEDFRPAGVDDSELRTVVSGGTTGAPAKFYHLASQYDAIFTAYRIKAWEPSGYTPARRALDLTWAFSGHPIRFNPRMNWQSYSISALNARDLRSHARSIKRFSPKYIIGYPSTVSLFAGLVRELGLSGLQISAVITGSEVLYASQKELIRTIFGCRVLEWYGLSELAGFAGFCQYDDHYHFFPQAGCVELVDDDGKVAEKEDEEGEIVLTGFHTRGTPFIRYRTGDRGVWAAERCDKCGRNYPIVKRIEGRDQDFLVGGRSKVPLSALNCHGSVFGSVLKYQFYQFEPGRIEVRLVRGSKFAEDDRRAIGEFLHRQLGSDFSWQIVEVSDIPQTTRGKHRFLIKEGPAAAL